MGVPPQEDGKRRISRRQALGILGAAGGASLGLIVGCGSDETAPASTVGGSAQDPTESPRQTPIDGGSGSFVTQEPAPEQETLSSMVGLIPVRATADQFAGYFADSEGFKTVGMNFGIENHLDVPLALNSELVGRVRENVQGASISWTEYEYGAFSEGHIDDYHEFITLPPHFRALGVDHTLGISSGVVYFYPHEPEDYSQGVLGRGFIDLKAQVAEAATDLIVNVPEYEPIRMDEFPEDNSTPWSKSKERFEDFKPGVTALTKDGNVEVEVLGFSKVDPYSEANIQQDEPELLEAYTFYRLDLNYSNLNLGEESRGDVYMYYLDQLGIAYPIETVDVELQEDRDKERSFGPGVSRQYFSYLAVPKHVTEAKIIMQGQEVKAYNLPLS